MNIAGRIIRDKNVIVNTSKQFFAKYKGHEIHASLFKANISANNEYSYCIVKIVSTKKGGNNHNVCSGILQRCNIRDVISHAINESNI